jgi:hypothetical protein
VDARRNPPSRGEAATFVALQASPSLVSTTPLAPSLCCRFYLHAFILFYPSFLPRAWRVRLQYSYSHARRLITFYALCSLHLLTSHAAGLKPSHDARSISLSFQTLSSVSHIPPLQNWESLVVFPAPGASYRRDTFPEQLHLYMRQASTSDTVFNIVRRDHRHQHTSVAYPGRDTHRHSQCLVLTIPSEELLPRIDKARLRSLFHRLAAS